MGKRHNRKRTRSRPRHRDGNSSPNSNIEHFRSNSVNTNSSASTVIPPYTPAYAPIVNVSADYWHQTYFAWQSRLRFEQERAKAVENHQLRVYGGEPGDEVSLFEPMMKVVTDLFDGYDDFDYS